MRLDYLKKDVEKNQAELKEAQKETLHWANKIQEIGVESHKNWEYWLTALSQLPDVLWDAQEVTRGVARMEEHLVQQDTQITSLLQRLEHTCQGHSTLSYQCCFAPRFQTCRLRGRLDVNHNCQ